mgnify:CR=1 FL=1
MSRPIWKIFNNMNVIIFVIEPKEAARRKQDIVSLREITFKKACFEAFAKYLGISTIDTTDGSIFDTFMKTMEFMKE